MNERTQPLQGVRVLLMAGIVLLHTYNEPIFGSGVELVSFFFVVSGFLYRDKLPWKSYVRKKSKSLFLVYWFVLLLYCLKSLHAGGDVLHCQIIPHIFLLQSWIPYPGVSYAFSYLGVSWFLSSLLFCYVCSPFLYRCIQRISRQRAFAGIFISFMVVAISHLFDADDGYGLWFAYISPYCRVFEYLIGMLLWRAIGDKPYKKISLSEEIISLLSIVVYLSCIFLRVLNSWTCLLHASVIGLCYLYHSKLVFDLLANKMILRISKYIMFVYLTHQSLILNFEALREKTSNVVGMLDIPVDTCLIMFVYCWIFGTFLGFIFNNVYRFANRKILK